MCKKYTLIKAKGKNNLSKRLTGKKEGFLKRIAYLVFRIRHAYVESEKAVEDATTEIKKGVIRQQPVARKNLTTAADAIFEYILDITESIYRFFYPQVQDINTFSPIPRLFSRIADKVLSISEKIYLVFFHPIRGGVERKTKSSLFAKIKQNYHIIFIAFLTIYLVRSLITSQNPKYFIIYVMAGMIFITMYFKPVVGLLMYYTTQMIIPKDVVYSFPNIAVGTPLMFGTIIFWLLGFTKRDEKFVTYHSDTGIYLLIMWLVLTMGTLFEEYGDVDIYLNITTLYLSFFLCTHIIGKDKDRLYLFLFLTTAIYCFYAYRVIQNGFYFGFGTGEPVTADFSGALKDNNELAAAMCVGSALVYGFSCIARQKIVRYVARAFFFLLGLSIILTNSRGGLLGFFLTFGTLYFRVIIRGKKKGPSIAALLVGVLIIGALFSNKIEKRLGDTKDWKTDASACNRVIGVWGGWQVLMDKPVFGCGLGGLYFIMMDYIPDQVEIPNLSFWEYFTEDSYTSSFLLPAPAERLVLHDAYMSFGAEGGIVIFILFPVFLFSVISTQRRLRKEIKGDKSLSGVYDLSFCIESSMFGYMLTATFLNNYMGNALYLTATVSTALYNVFSGKEKSMNMAEFFMLLMSLGWWSYFFLLYYKFIQF